jgi:hypothetical protein
MKPLLILLLVFMGLEANTKEEIFRLYQEKEYAAACSQGLRHFHSHRQDVEYVSLYAFACLHSDFIDRLAVPISILKHTEEARANAAYFSVILMQKKLLYHALLDGYDLSSVRLPTTDFILSKVFDLYAKDPDAKRQKTHHYRDPDTPKKTYKLYVTKTGQVSKMVIEEYYDTMLAHRHIYW